MDEMKKEDLNEEIPEEVPAEREVEKVLLIGRKAVETAKTEETAAETEEAEVQETNESPAEEAETSEETPETETAESPAEETETAEETAETEKTESPEEETVSDRTIEVLDEEAMKDCPYCQAKIPQIAEYCPYCGKSLKAKPSIDLSKNRKPLMIGAGVCAVILLLLFALPAFQKSQTYSKAKKALKDGNYDEAIETFSSLDDYKDSEKYVIYANGLKYFSQGDYEKAVSRFTAAEGLADSDKYVSYINGALAIGRGYLSEYYEEAAEDFAAAGDLLNARELADYTKGIAAFLNDDNDGAEEILKKLVNDGKIDDVFLHKAENVLLFIDAVRRYDKDDFSGVADLRKVVETDDGLLSDKAEPYIYYLEGREFLEQELYFSAYNRFQQCHGFRDSDELADSCIQERPATGIIYRNTTSGSVDVTIYDNADGEDLYVKIYDSDDELVETLYIRDGAAGTAYFQGGSFRMAIAYGDGEMWFGPDECFGTYGSYQRLLLSGNAEYYNFPGGNSFTLRFNVQNGNVNHQTTNYGDF